MASKKKKKLAFPLIRRVFPSSMAAEIVSVQPMTMPVGHIFYMNYTYDARKYTRSKQPFRMLRIEKK